MGDWGEDDCKKGKVSNYITLNNHCSEDVEAETRQGTG